MESRVRQVHHRIAPAPKAANVPAIAVEIANLELIEKTAMSASKIQLIQAAQAAETEFARIFLHKAINAFRNARPACLKIVVYNDNAPIN